MNVRSLVHRPVVLLAGVVAVALAGVAAALASQHVFGMLPCPWCALQRLIFLLIAALAAAALAWPGARRALAALGMAVAISGMSAAAWQHFVAAHSDSCALTLADKILTRSGLAGALPSVFAPMTSCADDTARLLGIPYALWSLALFAALGLVLLEVATARTTNTLKRR